MEIRTYAGFATMERSNSTAGSSTSTRPWWVSRLAWLKLRTAVGPSATARSCSAPSPIGPMNCENQSARAVDLGTTLRAAPRAHSLSSNNRPERNENCVTHVVGLKCYLCRRLLKLAHLLRRRGRHRRDAVLHCVLHLREGAHLDLAHALPRDAVLLGQLRADALSLADPGRREA